MHNDVSSHSAGPVWVALLLLTFVVSAGGLLGWDAAARSVQAQAAESVLAAR